MNAEFVVPAAAVEAAMQIAYPGMQHTGNPSYAYARKYVTKLLAAATPALTHAAVEAKDAEIARLRQILRDCDVYEPHAQFGTNRKPKP